MDTGLRPQTIDKWRGIMDMEQSEQLGQQTVEGRSEMGEPQSQALGKSNGVKEKQSKQKH